MLTFLLWQQINDKPKRIKTVVSETLFSHPPQGSLLGPSLTQNLMRI